MQKAGSFRLQKSQIIRRKKEISDLFHVANRWEGGILTILFENSNRQEDRLLILVSKKIGNAVVRNKIKRRIREMFRRTISKTPPFFDILIKPRMSVLQNKMEEITNCFQEWQQKQKKQ